MAFKDVQNKDDKSLEEIARLTDAYEAILLCSFELDAVYPHLDDEFIQKFLIKPRGDQSKLPTPPLKDQPMPSSEVVSHTPIPEVSQTGLTQTEQALLSDEEKSIRLRQRGLQT